MGTVLGMIEAIRAEDLTKRFDERVAVDHLNLVVPAGQVFGFLGPNGAGKTTTVRLLNGVLSPTAGRAWVMGHAVSQNSDAIRQHTGVLTEAPSLYEPLSGRENLRFYGDLYHMPTRDLGQRIDELLEEFGLADRASDKVGTYSKGMRQRLAIARALLPQPSVLFLDEPTSGLDPAAARMVTDLIRRQSHQEGRTIFLCTHNLSEAQRLCDQVGIIDQGTVRALGTPRELASRLWTEQWVGIELLETAPDAVSIVLNEMPTVLEWRQENGQLLVRVDGEEGIPDVVVAVGAAGGRIFAVRPKEHTLEDIYFRIQQLDSDAAMSEETQ